MNLLVATTRRNEGDSGNDNDFTTMRVSELRRMIFHEKGLGMSLDGSREAMIEALRNSALQRTKRQVQSTPIGTSIAVDH